MIKITPDTPGRVKVTFPYNPGIVAKVKTVKARKWHADEKYWSFPDSKPVLKEILSALDGEALDIDPSLGVSVQQAPFDIDALLDRVRDVVRMKHYSIRTEQTYLHWISRYLVFHKNRDPKAMAAPEVEAFLSYLATGLNVSASTQNVAFNSLLFLYRNVLGKKLGDSINAVRAKKPKRLPTVMTKEETCKGDLRRRA